MTTLQIEHAITDYPTWRAAFDRFAAAREQAGVRSHRVQHPIDDGDYVVIDLEFDSTDRAQGFLDFLHSTVWSSDQNAPALVGTPRTRILQPHVEPGADP